MPNHINQSNKPTNKCEMVKTTAKTLMLYQNPDLIECLMT